MVKILIFKRKDTYLLPVFMDSPESMDLNLIRKLKTENQIKRKFRKLLRNNKEFIKSYVVFTEEIEGYLVFYFYFPIKEIVEKLNSRRNRRGRPRKDLVLPENLEDYNFQFACSNVDYKCVFTAYKDKKRKTLLTIANTEENQEVLDLLKNLVKLIKVYKNFSVSIPNEYK